jgi:predicted transcriptional regulator
MAIVIKGTASDPDGDNISVQIRVNDRPWQNVTGKKDWSFNWNTKVETNGYYTITARVTDEHGAWSQTSLTIQVKNKGKPHQEPMFSHTTVALGTSITAIGLLAGAGGFFGLTELGRSKFWLFMLAFGLSKLKKDEVLDDFTRGSIYGCVKRDPGITPREVLMVLDIDEKNYYYHQDVLIKYGYIYKVKMNKFGEVIKKWHGVNGRMSITDKFTDEEMEANPKIKKSRLRWAEHYLYASGMKARKRLKLNKRQERVIYKYIRDNPGQSQGQIAKGLDMIRQGLAYYLNQFRKTGLIKVRAEGRKKLYFINEDNKIALS